MELLDLPGQLNPSYAAVRDRAGDRLMVRIGELRGISDRDEGLERTLFSPASQRAAMRLRNWMDAANLITREDALSNVIGLLPGGSRDPADRRIWIGSHYDTVVNAGAYDGTLGVLLAIGVAEILRDLKTPLRHSLGVIAFSDEEGVRFESTFLGSAFASGQFVDGYFGLRDREGKSLQDWLESRGCFRAELLSTPPAIRAQDFYLEAHIEQGPVLEGKGVGVGTFTAIAAQYRLEVEIQGMAGHAGTTPHRMRRDPLPLAARMILLVESLCRSHQEIRATVGKLQVRPNASNVIPDSVVFSVDLRHPNGVFLRDLREWLVESFAAVARERNLEVRIRTVHEAAEVACDHRLSEILEEACGEVVGRQAYLFSGAGHDAMMISRVCPTGMLAIRCRDGLSHHPDEFASEEDCRTALDVLVRAVLKVDAAET